MKDLLDLGFKDFQLNKQALEKCNFDLDLAVDYIEERETEAVETDFFVKTIEHETANTTVIVSNETNFDADTTVIVQNETKFDDKISNCANLKDLQ